MNLLIVLVVLSRVTLSFAATISTSEAQEPGVKASGKCCAPERFQGFMREIVTVESETPKTTQEFYEYAMDTYQQKMALRSLDRFTQKELSRNVIDFKKNAFYVITDGECLKIAWPSTVEKPIQCMPENAEHVSDFFVGGVKDGFKASAWRAHNVSGLMQSVEVAFSPNGIPVYENVVISAAGVKSNIFAYYQDVETKITTPEIFDVPGDCIDVDDIPMDPLKSKVPHPRKGFV